MKKSSQFHDIVKLAALSYYAAIALSRALLYSFYSCSNIMVASVFLVVL